MKLELVKASKYHSKFVWEWRNDQVSRKMFKNQNYVTWKDHNEWFEKSLLNSKRIMYVGILNENPVEPKHKSFLEKEDPVSCLK